MDDFKNDISKYFLDREIEVDDDNKILLIDDIDFNDIESIPYEMLHAYYIDGNYVWIITHTPPFITKIFIIANR